MSIIERYFPDLTPEQRERFDAMPRLYEEWNAKINVISRKDMDEFNTRHVLHSLAIAKVCSFGPLAHVMDLGTGGGFPGIPLAIMFPNVQFALVDSIGKKIGVVKEVVSALGLTNVQALNCRAESVPGQFDYVVSRAVTDMKNFMGWVNPKLRRGKRGSLHNGILYLKGGDLTQELAEAGGKYKIYDIQDFFKEEFFETKKVVYREK